MLFLNTCEDMAPIIRLIKYGVLPTLYIGIGIVILVLVIIDIAKAIIAGEDKEVKAAQKSAIRRVIYGVAIFFVVVMINLVFNLLTSSGSVSAEDAPTWYDCYSCVEKDGLSTDEKCKKFEDN